MKSSTRSKFSACSHTHMPFRHLTLITLIALLVFGLSACSFSLAEDIAPPSNAAQPVVIPTEAEITGPVYPVVPPDPQAGEPIYVEKCAPCHGELGQGDGSRASQLSVPVAALALPEIARPATPAAWFTLVTKGDLERFMPPFPSLSDRQRWDVVAYALTLSETAEDLALGESLYQDNCASCHGVEGNGDGPVAASLSGAPSNFNDQAFMAERSAEDLYQTITNGKGAMPAFAANFSEAERRALAAYARALSFSSIPDSEQVGEQSDVTAQPEDPSVPTLTTEITSTLPLTVTTGSAFVQVSNASGGELPEDLTATLYAFDSMQFTFSQTLSVHADGVFAFENLEFLVNRVFIASVDYQGSSYSSDVVTVENPDLPIALPILIYDATTDSSGLVVDRVHIFFDFSTAGSVQVVELFIVSNPSQQAVVASEESGAVISYQLPEGYTNLQFEEGEFGDRYLEIPGGFADTQTIPPGTSQYQVVFAFNLPYENKLKFEQPFVMGTKASVVLLPDVGIKLKADDLVDAGSRDVEGINYKMYNGGEMTPGSLLSLELSGSPNQGGATLDAVDSRTSTLIGIGALGVMLIGAGVWLYRRNRGEVIEEEEAAPEEELEADDPDELMDAIIALDDLYRARGLPDDSYQVRRQELKARLEKLIQA